jgi:hypothetical protein
METSLMTIEDASDPGRNYVSSLTRVDEDFRKIEPQPCGKLQKISLMSECGNEYWVEIVRAPGAAYLRLWECPFGDHGEPVLIDGIWRWRLI